MDGYRVMGMDQAAREGAIFLTVTYNLHAIRGHHFCPHERWGPSGPMRGHFNVEIDLAAPGDMAEEHRQVREYVEEYHLAGGQTGLRPGGRTTGQQPVGRGPSGHGDGYELRQSSPGCKWLLDQKGALESGFMTSLSRSIGRSPAARLQSKGLPSMNSTPSKKLTCEATDKDIKPIVHGAVAGCLPPCFFYFKEGVDHGGRQA